MAKEQNVSYSTAHRATRALQLHPYRIRVTHKLSPLDPNQHLHYCNWLLTNFIPAPMKPTSLNDFFPDQAWFSLSGYVNSQNNCYEVADNPYVHLEAPLPSKKNRCLVCFIGYQNYWASFFFYYHDHRRGLLGHY